MTSLVIYGDTSGSITLQANAVAGTNTITLPNSTGTVALTTQLPYVATYLLVAGGGGGGYQTTNNYARGGGGGGGLLSGTVTLYVGTVYSITVGAGGAVGVAGTNSTGFGLTALGGGYGGGTNGGNNTGGSGGSGGGGGGDHPFK
jgi:hypothetical protein